MAANNNIQLVGLDFDDIKTNLRTFLQGQETFKDYNFEGSGLSVLLDVLAYNTQYNAFYLNMIANEMFLDTALQRNSVVSHAKLLNYTPQSAIAPTAIVDVYVTGVTASSLTLPQYTNFLSESVDGVNYNFVNVQSITRNTDLANNICIFEDVELKQGIPASYQFTVDKLTNPDQVFTIPDDTVDTSTLRVLVQQTSTNSAFNIFTAASNYLILDSDSLVYFLEESLNGQYELRFGDDIIGKSLTNGNIVKISYVTTQGTISQGANNFVLMDSIVNFGPTTIFSKQPSSYGKEKESIDSIKFQAPKTYAAQNRAVTKDDYVTLINQNSYGVSFDAVNVWGGEENDPPVYGQVFICLKPAGAYVITQAEKDLLTQKVLRPISVLTVEPTIVDPDYNYLQLTTDVVFDSTKTTLNASDIENLVKITISNYATTNLNKFNSTFSLGDLGIAIKQANPSIVASDTTVKIQKKFYPNLTNNTTYDLIYGTPLQRGVFSTSITSYPGMQFRDPGNLANIIDNVYLEEVPKATAGVESINIINPGYTYTQNPIIKIIGDGTGANVRAQIDSTGRLSYVEILSSGNNYTNAIAIAQPAPGDTSGRGAILDVVLQGQYGTLRTYYFDQNNNSAKTILNQNIGSINYNTGTITLKDFNPYQIGNPFGLLTITSSPKTTLISSTYNRIITVDPFDPYAIVVNVTAKV